MSRLKFVAPLVLLITLVISAAASFVPVVSQSAPSKKPSELRVVPPAIGDAAAYEHARNYRSTLGTVLNERIHQQWLSDHELIYRVQHAGKHRSPENLYFIADAKAKSYGLAFDHHAVAKGVYGEDHGAYALRFMAFKSFADDIIYAMNSYGAVYAIQRETSETKRISVLDHPELQLKPTQRERSRDHGSETLVRFVNESKAPVKIQWLNRYGVPRTYFTLHPGSNRMQRCWAGQVWRALDEDDNDLVHFVATDFLGIAKIDGKKHFVDEDEDPGEVTAPGGAHVLCLQEYNLWYRTTDADQWNALTEDGSEVMPYTTEFQWSDDGRYLLALREQALEKPQLHLTESSPDDQLHPKLQSHDYLRPGDPVPKRDLRVIDLSRGQVHTVDEQSDQELYSYRWEHWSQGSQSFRVMLNYRGHQRLDLLDIDAKTGETKVLIEETSETFIDYGRKSWVRALRNGDALWMSERSGWNHLYRWSQSEGELKELTSGNWLVRSVEHVDEDNDTVLIKAVGVYPDQDPYHAHFGRIHLAGGEVTWLTDADGTHTTDWSPQQEYFVSRHERVDLPPIHTLRDARSGEVLLELAIAEVKQSEDVRWQAPTRFVAKGRDGETDIWGCIMFPSWAGAGNKFPVIERIYAGPHGHHVPKDFTLWRSVRELSELGFVVVIIDGMGTNWRSKAFHDVCWRNLKDAGFPDRIAWIGAAAEKYPVMDISRVGIYGASAGGQNAMRALLDHGYFYHVAVAANGNHDSRLSGSAWNEAYMGWPIGKHYQASSNVEDAHKLQGELLLTVGELDNNVDPAATMRVVDALIKADKDFDLLVIPGEGHGAGSTSYARRRRADYFVRHLYGVEPRRN